MIEFARIYLVVMIILNKIVLKIEKWTLPPFSVAVKMQNNISFL